MEDDQIVVDIETSPLSPPSVHSTIDVKKKKKKQSKLDKKKKPDSSRCQKEVMQTKLDKLWGKTNEVKNFTIFRTPLNICFKNEKLFYPSAISIGPFHRGERPFRAFEEQKWRFLQNFLSRKNHISLDSCISKMESLEEQTRWCYGETVDLKSKTFVRMMLLDGCFVLEFFLKFYKENLNYPRVIYRDLLLLENQIPFFIVEELHKMIGLELKDRMDFVNGIVQFLARDLTIYFKYSKISHELPAEIHHLVHLYYHCVVPSPKEPIVLSSNGSIKGLLRRFCSRVLRGRSLLASRSLLGASPGSTLNISKMVIPSATELTQKGLKFKPQNNPRHMLDISFEYGVLKIPRLVITNATKPIFANLIAFENSNYGKEHSPFTSFVTFLDNLVNTPNDVTILQQCGIIENWLGSEKDLTNFINQVTEGGSIGEAHYLAQLLMEVNRYIEINWDKSSWNRQRAKLIHDYFSSPWKVISLIVASILLVLTCVQTFYSVYAYKFPPSS